MFNFMRLPPLRRLMLMKAITGGGSWSTITGNPVSFTAKAAPLKQLSVAFSPVQDLHGYDSPWPAGGGKNKFDIDHPLYTAGSQNLIYDYCCKVEDGKLYNGGVAGATPGASITIPVVEGQTYTLSFTLNGENANWETRAVTLDGVLWTSNTVLTRSPSAQTGAKTTTVTIPSGYTHLYFACFSATKYGSWETDIQLELGSSASAWTPYSNECPISGWDGVDIFLRGENLSDYPNMISAGAVEQQDGSLYVEVARDYNGTIIFKNNGQEGRFSVTFIVKNDGASRGIYPTIDYTDGTSENLPINVGYSEYTTITRITANNKTVDKIRFSYGNALVKTWFYVMVVKGIESADWTPFAGRDISISLGQTVYSGWVDVVTGEGEADKQKHTFSAGDVWTYYDNGASSFFYLYPISARVAKTQTAITENGVELDINGNNGQVRAYLGKNPFLPADTDMASFMATYGFVYELAEPIPIQLTPQEVESLAGDNVLFSDSNGDLTVTYRSN